MKTTHQEYLNECMQKLQKHPFFSNLSHEDIASLGGQFTIQTCKAGDVIVSENELIDSIYFIADGRAEVTRGFSQMINISVEQLKENDFIGLGDVGLYSPDYKRCATVTAITDMVLFRLSIADFDEIIINNQQLSENMRSEIKFLMLLNFLENIFPLSHLSSEEKFKLTAKIKELHLPAESVIIKEFEHGTRCYFLAAGEVEVFRTQSNGTHTHLTTLKAPAIFGEAAIIADSPCNASIRTLTNCVLFTLDRKSFIGLIEKHATIEEALQKQAQERVQQNIDTLSNPNSVYLTKDGWLNYK